jgi:hypothetical protein
MNRHQSDLEWRCIAALGEELAPEIQHRVMRADQFESELGIDGLVTSSRILRNAALASVRGSKIFSE